MDTVAPPTAGQADKPALVQVFALGLALCALGAGALAEVEPIAVLLRAAVAFLVGRVVGKAFCAVSAAMTVPQYGAAGIAPAADDAPGQAA
jgi:hypothetical protein